MYNSFQIFTPQKKFRLTTNQIFYPSFIFLLFLFFEIKTQPYHFFLLIILFVQFLISIYLSGYRMYRIKPFEGELNGKILFETNSLIINQNKIDISEIHSLNIFIGDYYGKTNLYNSTYRHNLNPLASNGTNNWIEYHLINGETNKLFFQQEYEAQKESIRPFLIALIKRNILSITQVLTILEIEDEYFIQLFLRELELTN